MTTQEPNQDLRRMGFLSQQNDYNATGMDQNHPIGSPEDAASEFARNQAELNQIMVKTFTAINGRLEAMADDIGDIQAQQATIVGDIEAMKRRQTTMSNDIGQVKGGYAQAQVAREAGVIALDMGLGYVRNVEKLELALWAHQHSNSEIEASDLKSFRAADLIVQATDGSSIIYIAVEVSFTADHRDTDRSLRNADFLERFTGHRARAAIASVRNDDHVTEQVRKGLVHWYSIDQHSLNPD